MKEKGCLYLVATPIGNLEDMTYRAVRILKEADLIAAEDTRTSGVLLQYYDIHTPVTSYHEHNKMEKIPYLLHKTEEGATVAVITDAGTPGISDPGEELAAACIEAGIAVYAVPGAVAAVCAIISSGLSARRFAFEAFLPKKKRLRQQVLSELKDERRTIILYEAPHHLKGTLKELDEVLGEGRTVVLCRELTKKFEEKKRFTIGEARAYFETTEPRGEYVLVIEGKPREEDEREAAERWADISIGERYEMLMNEGADRKTAMKQIAAERRIKKNEVYAAIHKEGQIREKGENNGSGKGATITGNDQ